MVLAGLTRAQVAGGHSSGKHMAVGHVQAAKRALVKVLLALAVVYNVSLVVSRDSPDAIG